MRYVFKLGLILMFYLNLFRLIYLFVKSQSIRAFGESSMNTAYQKKWPLYLSTKNTILKKYDGRYAETIKQELVY